MANCGFQPSMKSQMQNREMPSPIPQLCWHHLRQQTRKQKQVSRDLKIIAVLILVGACSPFLVGLL